MQVTYVHSLHASLPYPLFTSYLWPQVHRRAALADLHGPWESIHIRDSALFGCFPAAWYLNGKHIHHRSRGSVYQWTAIYLAAPLLRLGISYSLSFSRPCRYINVRPFNSSFLLSSASPSDLMLSLKILVLII